MLQSCSPAGHASGRARQERDPKFLIKQGYLEPLEDFRHNGATVLASRLGCRITGRLVSHFFGKIFDNPNTVFTAEILQPERQDLDIFVEGISSIVETHRCAAQRYFDDQSIDDACPPLRALLHIMATGNYRGMDAKHPHIRYLFSREYFSRSDWYRQRLAIKQQRDIPLRLNPSTHCDCGNAPPAIRAGRLCRAGRCPSETGIRRHLNRRCGA